jgi:hypothetical protein
MTDHSYTKRERVAALAIELWRLREALIRTTKEEGHIGDLLRSLRVLVLDDGDALLLDLAGYFRVDHTVTTAPSIRAPAAGTRDKESGGTVIDGLVGVCMPDTLSRWRALRGIAPGSSTAGITVPFCEYLTRAAGADPKRGTAIQRKALLADMAEKAFSVHASKAYTGAMKQAALQLDYGPYYVTLAQELAYETLDYGQKVLTTALARLGVTFDQLDKIAGIAPRLPDCSECGALMGATEFDCPKCGRASLDPPTQDRTGAALRQQFAMFYTLEFGAIITVLSIPSLVDASLGKFSLGYVVDKLGDGCGLVRTADLKLSWRIQRSGVRHHAAIDISGFRDQWTHQSYIALHLAWAPGRAMIEILSRPRVFVTSDGLPWTDGEAAP